MGVHLHRRLLTVTAIVISSLSMVLAGGPMGQSAAEFRARWTDERNGKLVMGALWVASHYEHADEKRVEEVLGPVHLYVEAVGRGDGAALEQESIKAFKERVSGLLRDEDQSLRALAAVLLGVCGDKSYASRIAVLLEPRADLDVVPPFDRGRAAIALGLVGAKEYTVELVKLLKSPNSFDRSGAAIGLGALRATEHERAIAELLNDADDSVREAAKESLAMMRETPK